MLRIRLSTRAFFSVVLSLVLALALATAVIAASHVIRSGKAVTAVRTVVSSTHETTTSTTYADIPGMSASVTVPADQKALLIVTFSAQTHCGNGLDPNASADCLVRVLVDGNPADPAEAAIRSARSPGTGIGWAGNSMQFVYGPVSSGTHTVKVQFRVFNYSNTSGFLVAQRTLTVLRAKY